MTEARVPPAADRWLAAVHGLSPTPREDRERLVGRREALDILGCDPGRLDVLVREGLPVAGAGAGGPLFDFHDLINVGLYSGSGASLGESGERVLMRFAAQPPERWTGGRRWALQVEHRCPAGPAPGAWSAARPAPEFVGGLCERWDPVGSDTGDRLGLEGEVWVTGRSRSVVAHALRDLYAEWLADVRAERLRFQWLPPSLRRDPERAHALRVTDCVAASLMLERRARSLGFEARTRKGHLLGLICVEHAWAEARDADGAWKPVDPILPLVAQRAGALQPEFEEFCLGSTSNRVVPWDRGAGEDLATHACGAGAGVVSTVTGGAAR